MADEGFHEYVINEVLVDIDGISSRAMFGGYGIYKEKVFFALIANDTLYFKVDESNKKYFDEYESKPFVYDMKGKQMTMNYYELPADIMESREDIGDWVERSFQVAIRSKKK